MSLLSDIFSSPMMKITNQTKGFDVLVPIRVLKTSIKFASRTARHMMEDGSSKVDQRVLLPIAIEIELISPSDDVLLQINEVLLDRTSLFTIQTRGLIVENMRADYEGLDQSPRNISSTPLKYSFVQMLYQGQVGSVSAQAADSSVVDRGMTIISKAKETVSNISEKISNLTSSIF